MRYFAHYSNSRLVAIGTGDGGTEITENEYNTLLAEIREKVSLVDQLYSGEITVDDVPAEWQEEIQSRVQELIDAAEAAEEQEASAEDIARALEAIL